MSRAWKSNFLTNCSILHDNHHVVATIDLVGHEWVLYDHDRHELARRVCKSDVIRLAELL